MSDAGGVLYDKDAVYVEIPDWKVCVCVEVIWIEVSLFCPSQMQEFPNNKDVVSVCVEIPDRRAHAGLYRLFFVQSRDL